MTDFWTPQTQAETRPDGTIYVWEQQPLQDYPHALNVKLLHWADVAPDRLFVAERGPDGNWQGVTYAEAAAHVQAIGAALLARGLGPERPLMILSGNSVAHALMALGAQHVGVPSAALAPAYALTSGDHAKLRDVAGQMNAGAIFAEDAAPFAPAIEAVFGDEVPVIARTGTVPGRDMLVFDDLCATPVGPEVEAAFRALGPDTVAKFLFTSGTTGSPKAVIQTQRMICSNPQMDAQCYLFLNQTPPVICDWAPWNHTASGNRVFHMVVYFGGTYYIDAGKPSPKLIGQTIANLREISPTWYFNVPLGYQMLLDAMEQDDRLRSNFFRKLKMLFYAGAGMSQPVWDRLTRVAEAAVPGGVPLCTGFGATETGPSALLWTEKADTAGNVGVPLPGVTFKLVPQGDKLEGRLKGPAITPGYWKAPDLTAEAFDEERFYRCGDAFRFAEPGNPGAGFYFDGRLAENFKLSSGTWVAVGALRAALANDLKGLASDAVIAGEGRDELGALVVPDWAALRALAGEGPDEAEVLAHPKVRARTAELLTEHARRATGSASRVTRILYVGEPLSFDRGEVTDKGSINQHAVLRNRADLVAQLWSDDPAVIRAERIAS